MKTQKNQDCNNRKVIVLPESSYQESHVIKVDDYYAPLGNGSYAKASNYSKYGY